MGSAGLNKFFVIIGIHRMIGKGLVMAGLVPAIHAVMLQKIVCEFDAYELNLL